MSVIRPAVGLLCLTLIFCRPVHAQFPEKYFLSSGWEMQQANKVSQRDGRELSKTSYTPNGWYKATVPGTVLTTLVNNKVYPEPLYGENNRPDRIPETLCRENWWYRCVFQVPDSYKGRRIWLNFDGINYAAEVWLNNKSVGTINGAFIRGSFDITPLVEAGKDYAVAVRINPQFHPGQPAEHTLGAGNGPIGGVTGVDGPTFVCTIGWDWLPGIRDRDAGIWQKVYLSATGPVLIKNPQVITDLPLPRIDSADVTVAATVQNMTEHVQKGTLKGSFAGVNFERSVELPPESEATLLFDPKSFSQLHLNNPKLWWPNGLGAQNLYSLHLSCEAEGQVSDTQEVSFGIRKITYDIPGNDHLALSVNGVRVFCKGGDWGMDEALKRVPRERLEAQVRMHQIANYNMIRNWGGQSTNDELYDLCDKYGILLWDEFFQLTGDPLDTNLYMGNVADKVLRIRNHPSIAVWCGRNESNPPYHLDNALRNLFLKMDPTRYYQSNSGDGHGANSGGPYEWKTPGDYYHFSEKSDFNKNETFKTEIGAISVPTIESIQGMMPEEDWNTINDDWAEHDFMAGDGRRYPQIITNRYGKITNLADFVRKSQMMNYEAYRAMYEGREGQMFNPVQGILTWMSHPAQPSFVWQIYHYDLEPNAALFAVKKACEPVHIQLNEVGNGTIQVINNLPTPLAGAHAKILVYNLDGSSSYQHEYDVNAAPCAVTAVGTVDWPPALASVHFARLELREANGNLLSDNFYWRGASSHPDDLRDLNTLPVVTLEPQVKQRVTNGTVFLDVTLKNPGPNLALMVHLQLHREASKDRVLPAYYTDNYISLTPQETKTITIEAAESALKGEKPLVLVDGWNISVSPSAFIALNENAQIGHWPETGLPFRYAKIEPKEEIRVNCGGYPRDGFVGEPGQPDWAPGYTTGEIDTNVSNAAPEAIYQTCWWGEAIYPCQLLNPQPGQTYTVRLHFAELGENAPGKRVFNVALNGNIVLADLDVFKEAGGRQKAYVRDFTGITPDDKGYITVEVKKGKAGSPQISGLEIIKEHKSNAK